MRAVLASPEKDRAVQGVTPEARACRAVGRQIAFFAEQACGSAQVFVIPVKNIFQLFLTALSGKGLKVAMIQEDGMVMDVQELGRLCAKFGFHPAREQLEPLSVYIGLLLKWNKVMNLVGFSSPRPLFEQLVLDSFYLAEFIAGLRRGVLRHVNENVLECWDLGAGAGLPGIPLRILWNEGNYALVEPREKRALFMRNVLAASPLPGVRVFQGRAEEFMPSRPPADIIVSRAFMPWRALLGFIEPYLAGGGLAVFLAKQAEPDELPPGWIQHCGMEYSVPAGNSTASRFFWAIGRNGLRD